MYWDSVAHFYDLFENITNRKVYSRLGKEVAACIRKDDEILECACGTGIITQAVAAVCGRLVATDMSEKMLKEAAKKCRRYDNVTFEKKDIMDLDYPEGSFDAVIAANVIHLLDDPYKAIKNMERVCKDTGSIIIPTYINKKREGRSLLVKILDKSGAGFRRRFDIESYQKFFFDLGYSNIEFRLLEGRMNCMIAVIRK